MLFRYLEGDIITVSTVNVTVNGEEYTLTYNSDTGKYEGTITAPTQTSGSNNAGVGPGVGANAQGKGYYPITVKATDDAGNTTTVDDGTSGELGTQCRLKVLEKTAPTATMTYPTANATITSNKPTFAMSFGDSGSGINAAKCYVKVDGGAWTIVTANGSGTAYTASFTPSTALSDGAHSVQCKTEDYDGNVTESTAISFKIDTTPPTLVVSSPADNLTTNVATQTVSGTTNDATSSPVVLTVNGQTVTVNSDGSWSTTITLVEGNNTITVVATDSAGKSSTVTRTVVLNTAAPVITKVEINPDPTTAGTSYKISVTVTDS